MPPNSRPPLTSRIRASFEGKSRELKSPTSGGGGFAQDSDTLRAAIEQAISSDAFQAAIASHLAKLINPGIKSALDTIQPVVEAVYSHELLLRRTNASVEDLLTRIDTNADDGKGKRISVIRPGTGATEEEAERQHGPLSSHPPNAEKREEMERALDVPANVPASVPAPESAPAAPRSIPTNTVGIDFEQIKRLLDQRNSDMVSKLSTLSNSVDTNNSKITEVVDGMAEMNAALAPTLQTLPSMRSFSEQSTTATSVMQAQLDQMQTDMGTILQAVPADLDTKVKSIHEHVIGQDLSILASHTSKLDSISEEIIGLKEGGGDKDDSAVMETLQTISTGLESLKEHIETGTVANNDNFNTLGSQVTNVISTIEAQTATLNELKDSHTSHGTVLGEIKDRSLVASDAAPASNGPDISELQAKTEEILAAVKASNESHTAHTTVLGEIKERSLAPSTEAEHTSGGPDISELQAKVEEILAAIHSLNESHGAHTTVLGEIKERSLAAPTSTGPDMSELEARTEVILATVQALNESHTTHASVLSEIRERSLAPPSDAVPASSGPDLSELQAKTEEILAAVQASNESHAAHATALESIKSTNDAPEVEKAAASDGSESTVALQATAAEILAAVHKSNDSHTAHSEALEGLKSLNTAPASEQAPTSDNTETLTAVQALSAELASLKNNIEAGLTSNGESLAGLGTKVDDVLTTLEAHRAADQSADILAGVKESNEAHAAHKAALEGIKSVGPVDAAEAAPAVDISHIASLESKIDDVLTTLEAHRAADQSSEILAGVKESNESHAAHRTVLEGIKSLDTAGAAPNTDSGSLVNLESKLDDLLTKLEGHGTADQSAEIIAALKLQAEALEGLKSAPAADDAPTSDSGNLSNLEAKLDTVITTLEAHRAADQSGDILAGIQSHATALEGLKPTVSTDDTPVPDASNLANLEAKLDTVITTLEAHRAADQSGEILASVQSHSTALEGIKSASADVPTATDNGNLMALEQKLDDVLTTLEAHRAADQSAEILSGVRQANEAHTSHASALDGIKSLVVVPVSDAPSSDANNIAGLETSMNNIISTLESHTAALEDIKAKNLAGPTGDASTTQESGAIEAHTSSIITVLDLHKTALDNVLETLGSHTNLLTEIKEDIGAEILTGIHASNESHAAHAAQLSEIRESDVSDEVLTALHSSNDSHTSNAAAIAALHAALDDSHAIHTGTLEELKSKSVEPTSAAPDTDALKTQISAIATTLEAHEATLSSIRDATDASNVSHAAHIASLAEIKDASLASNEFHASHLTSLAEIKGLQSAHSSAPPPEAGNANFDALNAHINILITTLETQSATLNEIKEATINPEVLAKVQDSHGLLTAQQELLASHTTLLDTIKNENAHDDIMENITSLKAMVEESRAGVDAHGGLVKDLHEETKSSHSNLSTALAALAVGGVAGAGAGALASDDDSSEILSEIKTLVSSSSETLSSMVSQMEINNVTLTTSIATLSDELKSEIDASGTDLSTSVTTLSDELKTKIDASGTELSTSIKTLSSDLQGVTALVETMDGHVEQLTGLSNGVHLNEKGVFQLAEHAVVSHQISNVSKGVAPESVPVAGISREIETSDSTATQGPEETVKDETNVEVPIVNEPIATDLPSENLSADPVEEAEQSIPQQPISDEPSVESEEKELSTEASPEIQDSPAKEEEEEVAAKEPESEDKELSPGISSAFPEQDNLNNEQEQEELIASTDESIQDIVEPASEALAEEEATREIDPVLDESVSKPSDEATDDDLTAEVTGGESGEKGLPAAEEIVIDSTEANDPEIKEGEKESPQEPEITAETETQPDLQASGVKDETISDNQMATGIEPSSISHDEDDLDTNTAIETSLVEPETTTEAQDEPDLESSIVADETIPDNETVTETELPSVSQNVENTDTEIGKEASLVESEEAVQDLASASSEHPVDNDQIGAEAQTSPVDDSHGVENSDIEIAKDIGSIESEGTGQDLASPSTEHQVVPEAPSFETGIPTDNAEAEDSHSEGEGETPKHDSIPEVEAPQEEEAHEDEAEKADSDKPDMDIGKDTSLVEPEEVEQDLANVSTEHQATLDEPASQQGILNDDPDEYVKSGVEAESPKDDAILQVETLKEEEAHENETEKASSRAPSPVPEQSIPEETSHEQEQPPNNSSDDIVATPDSPNDQTTPDLEVAPGLNNDLESELNSAEKHDEPHVLIEDSDTKEPEHESELLEHHDDKDIPQSDVLESDPASEPLEKNDEANVLAEDLEKMEPEHSSELPEHQDLAEQEPNNAKLDLDEHDPVSRQLEDDSASLSHQTKEQPESPAEESHTHEFESESEHKAEPTPVSSYNDIHQGEQHKDRDIETPEVGSPLSPYSPESEFQRRQEPLDTDLYSESWEPSAKKSEENLPEQSRDNIFSDENEVDTPDVASPGHDDYHEPRVAADHPNPAVNPVDSSHQDYPQQVQVPSHLERSGFDDYYETDLPTAQHPFQEEPSHAQEYDSHRDLPRQSQASPEFDSRDPRDYEPEDLAAHRFEHAVPSHYAQGDQRDYDSDDSIGPQHATAMPSHHTEEYAPQSEFSRQSGAAPDLTSRGYDRDDEPENFSQQAPAGSAFDHQDLYDQYGSESSPTHRYMETESPRYDEALQPDFGRETPTIPGLSTHSTEREYASDAHQGHRYAEAEPSRYDDDDDDERQSGFGRGASTIPGLSSHGFQDDDEPETSAGHRYAEPEQSRYDEDYEPQSDLTRGLPTVPSLSSQGVHEEYEPNPGYGHAAQEPVDYQEEHASHQPFPQQIQTSNLSSPDSDDNYVPGASAERRFTPAEPFSYSNEYFPPAHEARDAPAMTSPAEESHAMPLASPPIDYEQDSATASASASTSAFASPTSPSFPGSPTKKGKKGKKEKKEKKEKKKKEKFVFDPDAEDEDNDAAGGSAAV